MAQPEVWVIGGPTSLVQGNLKRKLRQHGLRIGKHLGTDKELNRVKTIPAGVSGVIVIKDVASHYLAETVRDVAKASNVPFALVQRKWAHAEPILRAKGILEADAVTVRNDTPNPSLVEEVAVSYIMDAREHDRTPPMEEVEGALRRAFGRHYTLDRASYDMYASKASAQTTTPQPAEVVSITPATQQIADGTLLVIEDDPGKILDTARIRSDLQDLLGKNFVFPPNTETLIKQAIDEARERWNPEPNHHTPEAVASRNHRNELMKRWAKKVLSPYFNEEGEVIKTLPSQMALWKDSKAIFGCQIKWEIVRDVREELSGGAIPLRDAHRYYVKALKARGIASPLSETQMKRLLNKGVIKGFQNGANQWLVRRKDIDTYLEGIVPAKKAQPAPTSAPSGVRTVALAKPNPAIIKIADEVNSEPPYQRRVEQLEQRVAAMAKRHDFETDVRAQIDEAVNKAIAPLMKRIEDLTKMVEGLSAPAPFQPADSLTQIIQTAKTMGTTIEFKITP